ncbi:MAG TPA: SlyX family protein [Gammaproteobacteria bacterium]|nr:SlyX family protein [Gammaproteobacteria bacterium]
MEQRITDLEVRLSYQEAAIDELTRTTLAQQQAIESLRAEVEQLKSLLRELAPSAVAPASEETPPPHY